MGNSLSSIATVISLLAIILSGFTTYKVFSIEQEIGALRTSAATQKTVQPSPSLENTTADTSIPSPSSTPENTSPSAQTVGIQPGQFVQSAFGNKAKVELLAVKRIRDPETGQRNVVNVQFRARRLVGNGEANPYEWIYPRNTTARNPDTSEVYKLVDSQRATSDLNLNFVKRGESLDAYVWLEIPDGASTVDLYIPKTQVFKSVPITN
jgi:hypothetical protein